MRKRIVLGTACAHASAVLCLGIALLTGGAFAQKRELPLESAVSETPAGTDTIGKKSIAYVPIWKRITIGTYNGVNHIRIAFDDARMRIGNSADEILGRPAFPFSKTEAQLDLVVLTAADLGFQEGYTSLAEIYRRAIELGLNLCPAEVGPQLRLQYVDQPLGEFLHIAMDPLLLIMAISLTLQWQTAGLDYCSSVAMAAPTLNFTPQSNSYSSGHPRLRVKHLRPARSGRL